MTEDAGTHGRILVTGSRGLIGTAVCRLLAASQFSVQQYDIRDTHASDVLDREELAAKAAGCCGIVHLAAVSRVIWGEEDPDRCRQVNVEGLRNVLDHASAAGRRPWLLFASSREVYGRCPSHPVNEDSALKPMNVYGRTKLQGEVFVNDARARGMCTAVVRLSNVYGSASDHADRVVPAFVRAALVGRPLRVDGRNHTFDFTHVADVAAGLLRIVELLQEGERTMPVMHLVSGCGTTLGQLADLVVTLSESSSAIENGPERLFDVDHFVGDPGRAERVLGWRHTTSLRDGICRLIADFRAAELDPEHAGSVQ